MWPYIAGAVVLVLGIIGACSPSSTSSRGSSGAPYRGPGGGATVATTAPGHAAPAATAAAAKPSGPLTAFGDGTYEVGVDVAAGRYKTPGGSWCYWERARNDSGDFGSIISNDNLQGPGTVSNRPGEFFKTSGGCQWTKQ